MKDINQTDRLRFDQTLSSEKRIQTGSYYTPPEMAELMVCLSLATALSREKMDDTISLADYLKVFMPPQGEENAYDLNALFKMTEASKKAISKKLMQFEVLDLCAGSGVFPLAYMNVVGRWFERLNLWTRERQADIAKKLHVIDIQFEPLLLYAEEMELRYNLCNEQLRIYCLDALDDEQLLKDESLSIAMKNGFDLVLGNPPYIGEKNNKEIFQKLRQTPFGLKYYEGRMDYFYYFIYRAVEALKPSGQLCFITTNYFATADGAKHLRDFFKESGRFNALVNFNDCSLFKDALGQHNVVFVYEKGTNQNEQPCYLAYPANKKVQLPNLYKALIESNTNEQWVLNAVKKEALYDYQGLLKLIPSEDYQDLLVKLRHAGTALRSTLGEVFYVQQGIVSGFDRDFKENQGVFVLTREEADAKPWLKPQLKPFYKNKQIRKYKVVKPTSYEVLYLSEKVEALEAEKGQIFEHLMPYRQRLSLRREVVNNIRPWYALQWPREPWRFEGPLIAAPQRAYVNVFAYEATELYGSADIYYIADRQKLGNVQKRTIWMTAYLNSPIVYFWLSLMGKRKGSMLELYATPLKSIPILEFDDEELEHVALLELIENFIEQLGKNEFGEIHRKHLLEAIHHKYYQLLSLSDVDIKHIEDYYVTAGGEAYEKNYWKCD